VADFSAKIASARKAGYSDSEITSFLGADPGLAPKIQRAKAAGYGDGDILSHLTASATPPAPKGLVQNITGAMANLNRGLGIGDELAAAGGTAADIIGGKATLSDIGNAFNANMAKQRQFEDGYRAAHPNLAALSQGTGNAITALVPAGKTANAFAEAPRIVNAVRGATTAGITAAGYAAADRGTARERLGAAADAAHNPVVLALGAAGGAMAPAARKVPKGKISQDVIDLRAKDVLLTPGQARGGLAKTTEDVLTSTPILGTEIQNARRAGLETFNTAAANDALAPVGLKVPANIPAGHQTIAHVESTLGKLYDTTIPTGGMVADNEFKQALGERVADIAQDMTADGRKRLAGILQQRVTGRFGQIKANPADMAPSVPGSAAGMVEGVNGKTYQTIHSGLGTAATRFKASQDVDQRAIGEALEAVQQEMRNAAARQSPEFAAKKAAIDKGWALFKRAQGAAASLGAEGGVFTAPMYGGAVRRADRSLDKGASARGGALGQDLADAARAVLPSKVPDSGTAGRGMVGALISAPAAISAGFATGGIPGAASVAAGYGATLGGLKLASKLYSPKAIEAANIALDTKISSQQQAAAMAELKQIALREPKVAQLYQEIAARLSRTAGLTASSNAFAQPARP